MERLLAFGSPNWPATGRPQYDWWPLVFPLVAIVLAAGPLRMPLSGRRLAALAVGGTVAAWAVDVAGLVPAIAVGVLALVVSSAIVGRRPRSERNPG
jgi:hypothetical protein